MAPSFVRLVLPPALVAMLAALLMMLALPATAEKPACTAAGSHEGEMRHGVLTRDYTVYVPKSAPATGRSMVVGLHGGWGTGEIFAEQAKLKDAADKDGFVLLLPDGFRRSWNAGSCCGPASKNGVDDVGFITKLVKHVQAQHCVATERTYATGFSNGAMLTHRIHCEAPGTFAAMAPVAGGPMIDMAQCDDVAPIPALLIQGRDDPRIFWEGGEFDGSYRPAMAAVVKLLSQPNKCTDSSTKSASLGPGCETRACGTAPLTWCGVPNVGHQWPGGKSFWTDKLGPNRSDVDATAMIFAFFRDLTP
ncbi:MAG: PHB depolymerase family esterase [Oceanococcaceae bacterium]